jgi:hypothetical protein
MGIDGSSDCLEQMFSMREHYMHAINRHKPGAYPDWPVDISEKSSQQAMRDTALRGVEEVFEAMQHCRNWKPHRNFEDRSFDRDKFLEEMVDSFNYFLSLLVMIGVDPQEFFHAFEAKNQVIHERLRNDY